MSTVQTTSEPQTDGDGAHANNVGGVHTAGELQTTTDPALPRVEGSVQTKFETQRADDAPLDIVLSGPGRTATETHLGPARPTVDPERITAIHELRLWSREYWDAQDARKRMKQRFSAPVSQTDMLVGILAAAKLSEKMAGAAMRKCFARAFPEVAAWVKTTPGLGDHSVARLLGEIGHPVIATPYRWEANTSKREMESGTIPERILVPDGEPYVRSVGQLWAYCGVGAPERRRRGMSAEDALALGKPSAKTLVYLIALGTMKLDGSSYTRTKKSDEPERGSSPKVETVHRKRSPYRDVYDLRKAVTTDREWTDGHRSADALRIVGKQFLADLYDVCKAELPD